MAKVSKDIIGGVLLLFLGAPLFTGALSVVISQVVGQRTQFEEKFPQNILFLLVSSMVVGISFYLFFLESKYQNKHGWKKHLQGLGYLSFIFFAFGVYGLGASNGFNRGENILFGYMLSIGLGLFGLYLCLQIMVKIYGYFNTKTQ
ncbi:MAG: hypothetical protein IV090_22165 [Candidatus Sericytochromatia bacterium]|nr:hypothetical protein [Candidatus Sericytochromatia bacterium]